MTQASRRDLLRLRWAPPPERVPGEVVPQTGRTGPGMPSCSAERGAEEAAPPWKKRTEEA